MIIFYFFNYIKKQLTKGLKHKGGRNFFGRVCIRGRGGGNKKLYRFIDFYRRINQYGKILKIFKDSNRTGKIALILYTSGLSNYLLIQKDIKINNIIYSGSLYNEKLDLISNGFSLPIKYMSLFSTLSNVENKSGCGSILARSASVSCLLMSKDIKYGYLKFNSG
jgi:large subunit ribosomal protein L2